MGRDRERTRAEKKDVQNEREGRKYAKKKRRRRRSEERERQWRRLLLIPSKSKPSPTTSRPSAEARRGLFFRPWHRGLLWERGQPLHTKLFTAQCALFQGTADKGTPLLLHSSSKLELVQLKLVVHSKRLFWTARLPTTVR